MLHIETKECRLVSTSATVEHTCPEQVGKSHIFPLYVFSLIAPTAAIDS